MFVHYIRTWMAVIGLFMALMHPLSGAGLGLPSEMFAWGVLLRADSTIADTAKKSLGPPGIGDPTNTDLPYFYPSTLLNRKGLSKSQQSDRYLQKPKGYNQLGSIDSTLATIMLYEVMEGVDVGTITPMSLDDYFRERRDQIQRQLRDSSLSKYELKKPLSEAEIAKLLDQATNITIPLPQNALFSSIFGKPEISITVNGEVNVTAGWRWDSQALGTASVVGQSQSAPVFNQNIQVNVSGRIGDKFKMNVDWNTLNQFEFNNRFKVGFDGYDDDIIKKVEFGNVNLETQSSLIGGGQTLFGVRADFQFGPLFLKTIASQRRAERRTINARGGASRQQFSIRAYDYAKNHFFLDTNYFAVWRAYHSSVTPVLPIEGSALVVKGDIEVWESTTDLKEVQASEAVAIADLQPIKYAQGERYDPSLRNQEIRAGIVERGRFVRLDPKRYEVDLNLGTLTVLNIRNDRYYAVGYRVEGKTVENSDDEYYGTLTTNANERDTLILKLIARPQMQPGFRTLWKRMMRNRYNIGVPNINPQEAKIGMWYYRR
ncbi:MAG: cell surface protein SprA, partial [Ignavibacteria bacterium]